VAKKAAALVSSWPAILFLKAKGDFDFAVYVVAWATSKPSGCMDRRLILTDAERRKRKMSGVIGVSDRARELRGQELDDETLRGPRSIEAVDQRMVLITTSAEVPVPPLCGPSGRDWKAVPSPLG
ncbi:hypothetical protein BaRGS_00011970, partial [Batillaria attramentaria]